MSLATKLTWIFLFIAIALLLSFLKDKKGKNKKVIFFGDSLTQAGVEPGGFISLIKDILVRHGINNCDLIGAGISGNKVYDLYLRMPEDIIERSPDIVIIWIGVNDVWHKSNHGTGTDADKFEKFYHAIVNQLQANKIKAMLVTPAVIGEKNDHSNPQDSDLNKYSQMIINIAKDSNFPLCDLHSLFHLYEVNNNTANADKGILTSDGIHLNDAGNRFVAEEMWKVLKEIL